jgi:hypothetical protein
MFNDLEIGLALQRVATSVLVPDEKTGLRPNFAIPKTASKFMTNKIETKVRAKDNPPEDIQKPLPTDPTE